MANRYFTVLIVPERESQLRKIIIPSWLLKGSIIGVAFAAILGVIMVADYWYVMSQIGENKQLKIENRRLRQQVQVFKNKMTTIESAMERIKTFSTRLKVITNIEDRGNLVQSLNEHTIPDAGTNIASTSSEEKDTNASPEASVSPSPTPALSASTSSSNTGLLLASLLRTGSGTQTGDTLTDGDPENAILRREYDQLDAKFSEINHEALLVEQTLADQYELLADQKAFLAALPTRKPAVGYFTSGFGVRKSPYGGRVKMHEGLDIANYPGTAIKATADGVVIYADIKPGYGQTVIVDHGYGLETWYAHAKKIQASKGQKVRRGDTVALLGNSGRSTGPHVHYEVRVHGIPVDPLSYILEN